MRLSGQQRLQEILSERYTVESEIGKGGHATVYLARDNQQQRNVAIKLLNPELSASLVAERFRSEVAVLAALEHPNIIPILESGTRGSALYYVMPLVEGETLRTRITREGRMSLIDAIDIAEQLGAALAHAHSRRIVHRDIKPENALLTDGRALLMDFGIAKAIEQSGSERLTGAGNSIGTPVYMSPEQARGDAGDQRSDIYSLACVVFEMVAGEPPISGATQQVMIRKLTTSAPKLGDIGVLVPPSVEEVLAKALAREPNDRYARVEEFVGALASASMATPTESIAVPVTATRPVADEPAEETKKPKWLRFF